MCHPQLWSPRDQTPLATIDTRANACSVRFCPWDPYLVAVGSAAHSVLLYDLRRAGGTSPPLATLPGHRKAVSYVRWATPNHIVSASTDGTLRLWDIRGAVEGTGGPGVGGGNAGTGGGMCVRTYTGHTNDRNFVGLSVDGDFIATGSETNEVSVRAWAFHV